MSVETNVQSNAFNFGDFFTQGVDPRTGHFAASLSLPSFQSADLNGPAMALSLSHSLLNTADAGFGKGWALNLSRFSPQNHSVLTTSSGESFKVAAANGMDAPASIPEQKIETFRFYANNLGTGPYRLVHRGGVVEELTLLNEGVRQVALPTRLVGPLGHALHLEYELYRGMQLLQCIKDDAGQTLLEIVYGDNVTRVALAPLAARPGLALAFSRTQGRLLKVSLDGIANGNWELAYQRIRDYDCLVSVKTPQGGQDELSYDDRGHAFPGGALPALPRVTRHRRHPGLDQPTLETRWTYTQQNYLGNGALTSWNNDGSDQLYQASDDSFRYGSTETTYAGDTAIRQTTRRYNRFHQMVDQETNQDGHRLIHAVEYHMEPGKPFADQPAYCQMPKVQTTRWQLDGVGTQVETTEQRFDFRGNPVWEKGPNGVETTYEYYPPEGDGEDCPPDPYGFGHHLKYKTLAPATNREAGAPTLVTHYRYQAVPGLADSEAKGLLVMAEERLLAHDDSGETLLKHSRYAYHQAPTDRLRHGRLHIQRDEVGGYETRTEFTYDKQGTTLDDSRLLTTVTITGFDGERTQAHREHAMLTGLELASTDADGVVLRRAYDALQRTVLESVEGASGEHKVERRYEYHFAGPDGEGNSQVAIDVNGVRERTLSDGLGREVGQYRQIDASSDEYPLTASQYNALGQRVQASEFDDYRADGLAQLTTHYTYDAWGNLYSTRDPSGLVSISRTLPITSQGAAALESWIEHPNAPAERQLWQYTQFNTFGKPELQTRLEGTVDAPSRVGETRYRYDGSGRCVEQTQTLRDEGGGLFDQVTAYRYDAFDRLLGTLRADDTEVRHVYVEHSDEALPTRLAVFDPSQGEEVVAGAQVFDGLGRLAQRTVGSLTERFTYREGSARLWRRTQPSGYVSTYHYVPALADTPTRIEGDADNRQFEYDSRTGQVTAGQARDSGQTAFSYNALGEAERLTWQAPDGSQHETRLSQSRQGRRLKREDDAAMPSQYLYDDAGRPYKLMQGPLTSECRYDAFGRVSEVTTTGPAGNSRCLREYDTHGRECARTIELPGAVAFRIEQHWRDDDMPFSRTYYTGGIEQFIERFEYDALGRLTYCEYAGQSAWFPQDRHGTPIAEQTFIFDALGNASMVITRLVDNTQAIATHAYAEADPCRLTGISYAPASYAPAEQFAYDANGCLLNDGQGRTLHYDARSRLASVSDASGTLATYRYDPHDALAATTAANGEETRWYYEGLAPSHSTDATGARQYLWDLAGQPAAEHDPDGNGDILWLGPDLAGSVRAEAQGQARRQIHYSAYGQAHSDSAPKSQLGFNGERRDNAFDGYPLGQGYRAYLPHLMRFNAPDSLSPFDAGGLNPYAYAAGNPIIYRDPTGHYNSEIVGPERRLPAPEQPQPSLFEKWLPVGIAVVMMVVGMLIAPPSAIGMAAFAVSAGMSAFSIGYNTLVAADVISSNSILSTIIFVADMAVGIGTGAMRKGAGAAVKAASRRSSVDGLARNARRIKPTPKTQPKLKPRPRPPLDGVFDRRMPVSKVETPSTPAIVRRTSADSTGPGDGLRNITSDAVEHSLPAQYWIESPATGAIEVLPPVISAPRPKTWLPATSDFYTPIPGVFKRVVGS